MNVKFLLFCIASFGSLMMLYMWFSANSTIKETQNNEEQYIYRISSLKSEIEVEKRLMESLRKDVKINSNNILDKTSVIDKINKKGVQFDKEKAKLEKEMETLRSDINKLTNSNEEEKKKLESEYEVTLKDDNNQIDSLENEIKKLAEEKKDLLEKQTKINKNIKNSQNDKIIDNTMQGKAPIIKEPKGDMQSGTKVPNQANDPNKLMNQNKKQPKNDTNKLVNLDKMQPENDPNKFVNLDKKQPENDPHKLVNLDKKQPENDRNKLVNLDKKQPEDDIKAKPDAEPKKPLADTRDIDIHDPHVVNKAPNIKPVRSNDMKDLKEDFPVMDKEKSKLNQGKDNSQLFPPDSAANDLNNQKNKDSQREQMNKNDFHADHQLKPPKNDKDTKDEFIKGGMLLKNHMKKDFEKDM